MGNQWGQSVYSIIIIIAINVCENNTLEGFFPHTNRLPFFCHSDMYEENNLFTSLICRISSVYSKNFLEFSRISNKWHPHIPKELWGKCECDTSLHFLIQNFGLSKTFLQNPFTSWHIKRFSWSKLAKILSAIWCKPTDFVSRSMLETTLNVAFCGLYFLHFLPYLPVQVLIVYIRFRLENVHLQIQGELFHGR